MKNNKLKKISISVSREHEKCLPDITSAFGDLKVEYVGGLMRFSAQEMAMQVMIFLTTAFVGGAAWDLLKIGIKKLLKKFPRAYITIRGTDSITYSVKPDQTINVIVIPERAKEFEHIRSLDNLIVYLRDNKKSIQKYNPSGWPEVRLADIGNFSKGAGILKDQLSENGHNAVRYGELYTRYNFHIRKIYSHIPSSVIPTTKKIKYGDILFAGSGETIDEIGKSAAYLSKEECYAGGDVIIFSPKNADSLFLSYFLNIGEARKKLRELGQGQSVVHIYKSDLENVKLHLPSLQDQKNIAMVISAWDHAIEKLVKKIKIKKNIKKGLMQSLLTGKVRLAGFNDKWETFEVGELLDYEQPTKYIVKSTEYSELHKIPVLTANKSFILGYTDETDDIYRDTPAIIFDDFTMDNKYVDFSFKVKSSAIKILKQKNNKINLRFVFEKMQLFNIIIGQHKRNYISEYQFLTMDMPSIKEQDAIANIIITADSEIKALEKRLAMLKDQKKYLLNNLITGQIRVPGKLLINVK